MRDNVIPGTKYSMLTVLGNGKIVRLPSGQTNRFILCKCDCGTEKEIRYVHLKNAKTRSCGCIRNSANRQSSKKLYRVLRSMMDRCDGKVKSSLGYLKKGITVCDLWRTDFMAFINWAEANGYKEGLQIDRVDNSKGYSHENCRWVTPKVNCNNRDITLFVNYKGKTISLRMLLQSLNKEGDYYAIRTRLKRNWDSDKAIDTPIKIGNYKNQNRI